MAWRDRVRGVLNGLRAKAAGMDLVTRVGPQTDGGWYPVIREGFPGAWQRGMTVAVPDVLRQSIVFACTTLIANDISKLCFELRKCNETTDVSEEVTSATYSPVLRKPNHFQNRMQFFESWALSKWTRGNTYVLKVRDNATNVRKLFVLDPLRVLPMVAASGDVYYQVQQDYLAGVGTASLVIPASEIIHDRMNCLYHPLVGLSPIHAGGLAAMTSIKIQENSAQLFRRGSLISGVLTAPATISDVVANRVQEHWEKNFAGEKNAGKVAVLGDGLKFEKMAMSAVDAQLIEQLKWSDEQICSVYHIPPYMVGVGAMPTYNNIDALSAQYYTQCLQHGIEAIELCLEEGTGAVDAGFEIEANLEGLSRMDAATLMKATTDGVKGGVYTPNEARQRFNLKPLTGGDTVYLQQQDYSISALYARDQAGPPSSGGGAAPPQPNVTSPPQSTAPATAKLVGSEFRERLRLKAREAGLLKAKAS